MTHAKPHATSKEKPRRIAGVLAGVIAAAFTVSCSSSPDALSQLGLSPEALQSAESGEPASKASTDDGRGEAEIAAATDTRPAEDAKKKPAAAEDAESDRPANTSLFGALFSSRSETPAEETTAAEKADAESNRSVGGEQTQDEGNVALAAQLTRQKTDDAAPARKNLLSAFFSPSEQRVSTSNPVADSTAREEPEPQQAAARSNEAPQRTTGPLVGSALPGVRDRDALFEITRGSGNSDNSDIDLYEQTGSYQVASAAGMARLAPNGLLKQRDSVDVSCFKPRLVQKLKRIERHFGKRVVITSGYRSPAHNKRVRGARNSYHMSCSAADIQIKGVGKWELARYARSLPGRGGVGTYCHTRSIHVDVGPERDWNWSC